MLRKGAEAAVMSSQGAGGRTSRHGGHGVRTSELTGVLPTRLHSLGPLLSFSWLRFLVARPGPPLQPRPHALALPRGRGLRPATTGYDRLRPATTGYDRLLPATTGYYRLRPATTGYDRLRPAKRLLLRTRVRRPLPDFPRRSVAPWPLDDELKG